MSLAVLAPCCPGRKTPLTRIVFTKLCTGQDRVVIDSYTRTRLDYTEISLNGPGI